MDYYGKESISNNNNNNNSKLLPIILLVASAAAIAAMFILQFFVGVYFFFFFLPLTFSLPWSIKRLWGRKARKQWNVEDLRYQMQKSSLCKIRRKRSFSQNQSNIQLLQFDKICFP